MPARVVADGLRALHRDLAHRRDELGAWRRGHGVSSTTFWWRRWIEQSRSKRCTMLPCAIAEHLDLDVARPEDRLLEVDGVVAEGALRLAPRALAGAGELVLACATRRMPLPPPPAAALSITG